MSALCFFRVNFYHTHLLSTLRPLLNSAIPPPRGTQLGAHQVWRHVHRVRARHRSERSAERVRAVRARHRVCLRPPGAARLPAVPVRLLCRSLCDWLCAC
jgi:hypothetical protein